MLTAGTRSLKLEQIWPIFHKDEEVLRLLHFIGFFHSWRCWFSKEVVKSILHYGEPKTLPLLVRVSVYV